MRHKLPNLTVSHPRIDNPNSMVWDLTALVYEGGTNVFIQNKSHLERLRYLWIKHNQIEIVQSIKEHAEGCIEVGFSPRTVATSIRNIKSMFTYLDKEGCKFDCLENMRHALFEYSEHLLSKANLKQIKHRSAYQSFLSISRFLNAAFEDLAFFMEQTRLKSYRPRLTVLGRSAEKLLLSNASQLAKFCFEITQSVQAVTLSSGQLPIVLDINSQKINLTASRRHAIKVDSDFTKTQALVAFNYRVASEVFIFLGMTMQNQSPTYSLKRTKFDYKPLGDSYEVREYKSRRGGEVLFKIPKQYKPSFESYLSFIDEVAPESCWVFPFFKKSEGFRKRNEINTNRFKELCIRYGVPWVPPSTFRKVGLNILLRFASDSQTAADFGNHSLATFRGNYEFPSQQRAMIEVGRFWDENDPLALEQPTVSLFNSPCNGKPELIEGATNRLPHPDCVTPTGCIGCKHYRDDDSFDYVWNLHSFKYLKIIESSSYRTKEGKPSNIVIDWVNLKINWFNNESLERKEWVVESQMRVEEGDYHPIWARKIEKYEG
ncbi:hypothetical protein HYD28_01530 [Pseudoalteromonas shioyasakiensis]|nr:hypothetical protein HYD28_01530 [Pseudoalteromonas shioyasakiensis]